MAVHTAAVIASSVDKGDTRFWKPVDDPLGCEDDPPEKVVAVPIAVKTGAKQQAFSHPRGVVVAVNKIGGGDFSLKDIEAVKAYNCLAARMIDISGYFATNR